jgi:ElaB/YqjD/DUF883 family membrane-anchored ribosome-binding protein
MKQNETNPGHDDRRDEPTQTSGLGADGEREAAQIRHNIAQTRTEMSGTIEELHGKLNPTVLKEQAVEQFHDAKEKVLAEMLEAKETVKAEIKAELAEAKHAVREATIGKVEHMVHKTKDTVKDTGVSLLDMVKQNPIPVAMVGVGVAWLVMNGRSGGRTGSRLRGSMYEPGGDVSQRMYGGQGLSSQPKVGGAYGSGDQELYSGAEEDRIGNRGVAYGEDNTPGTATQTVQRRAGKVAEQSSQLARRAQTSISQATRAAGARMTTMAHGVQEQGRRLEGRVEEAFHENPLLVGAAAFAAGTLIGLAIPITRREDAIMGKTRDGLMQKAGTAAQGALDKVQEAAKRIGEDSARDEGGNGNRPAGSTRNGSTSGSPSMPR